ncbi:MAG: Do family serine endopeptidase [Bacteroidetes bacterium]|nr:MAG: Do family serine endopeptidase [Bacteroidota bacterium]
MKKLLTMVLAASVGGIVAVGIIKTLEKRDPASFEDKQKVAFANLPALAEGQVLDFTQASELATPTVVHIISTVENIASSNREAVPFDPFDFFDMPAPGPQTGSGSGVIITDDGYIATNNHVIENASRIEVILNDKRSYSAKLIGADPQTDLALLKIEEEKLPFLRFGNSDVVKVGEWVLAVGNPFNLTSTVTAGIVSAKGRNINLLRSGNNQYAIENFIQTDAAVNPGNSGGALVNLRGELVGINTAIASQTGSFSGYSFAVPVNIVKKVMDDLLKYGAVQRGFLGISIQDVDAKLAQDKNLSDIKGVYVADISEDGAAAKAGLKKGDVVVKVNEVEVNSSSSLQEQVSRYHPGDKISITYLRDGKEKTAQAVLKNKEGNTEIIKAEPPKSAFDVDGARLSDVNSADRKSLKINHGVKVSDVKKGAFKDAGIPEGFIITKVDKRPVYSAKELSALLAKKDGAFLIEGVTSSGEEKVFGLQIKGKVD